MCGQSAAEANNWAVPDEQEGEREAADDESMVDTDVLSEEQIEAILSEMPKRDAYTDEDLEAMEAEYLRERAA